MSTRTAAHQAARAKRTASSAHPTSPFMQSWHSSKSLMTSASSITSHTCNTGKSPATRSTSSETALGKLFFVALATHSHTHTLSHSHTLTLPCSSTGFPSACSSWTCCRSRPSGRRWLSQTTCRMLRTSSCCSGFTTPTTERSRLQRPTTLRISPNCCSASNHNQSNNKNKQRVLFSCTHLPFTKQRPCLVYFSRVHIMRSELSSSFVLFTAH